MKKKFLFFLFIFITLQLVAQRKNFWLHGMVKDSSILVKNVHILNLNTEKGTFSNDYGQYRIVVSVGDTLEFTSVQYESIKKIITDPIAYSKKLNISLEKKTHVLDEIVLKKHNLTGNLLTDRQKTPVDLNKKTGLSINEYIQSIGMEAIMAMSNENRPSVKGLADISLRSTDPTASFVGAGSSIRSGIGTGKRKKKKLKKIISSTFTTQNVIDEIGKKFFIELKIHEKDMYSFIDYCKKFNIKQLYEQNKILELITLFQEKSAVYLKEIKTK